MSDPPETLYAWPTARSAQEAKLLHDKWVSGEGVSVKVEYRRADTIMDDPRVKALVETLVSTLQLLKLHTGPDDAIANSVINRAVAAIARLKEPK
jgi:hypothetical protein